MIGAAVLAAFVAAGNCGQFAQVEPPADYLAPAERSKLALVERFHFTAAVERLRRGVSGTLGGDIAYTLERFPNHHRALAAMARLSWREQAARPLGARYTTDCYFERALRFNGSDAVVRSSYGSYLLATGRTEAALSQMLEATRLDPLDAATHYNLGLLFFEYRNYREARRHARHAAKLGLPLAGLKNKLSDARQWHGDK